MHAETSCPCLAQRQGACRASGHDGPRGQVDDLLLRRQARPNVEAFAGGVFDGSPGVVARRSSASSFFRVRARICSKRRCTALESDGVNRDLRAMLPRTVARPFPASNRTRVLDRGMVWGETGPRMVPQPNSVQPRQPLPCQTNGPSHDRDARAGGLRATSPRARAADAGRGTAHAQRLPTGGGVPVWQHLRSLDHAGGEAAGPGAPAGAHVGLRGRATR